MKNYDDRISFKFFVKGIQDLLFAFPQHWRFVFYLFVFPSEGLDDRGGVPDVIADDTQGLQRIEILRNGHLGGIAPPDAIAAVGQLLPGKINTGIHLAAGRYVFMADEIGGRYAVGLFQRSQQGQEAAYLLVGEGLKAIIVDLNTYGRRVDVRVVAPFGHSTMPGAQVVIEHMMNGAVLADHIMGADLAFHRREGAEGLFAAVLRRMMDDHKIGLAQVEIGGAHPIVAGKRIGQWGLPDHFGKLFRLLPVRPVGSLVRTAVTAEHKKGRNKDEQNEDYWIPGHRQLCDV